MYELTLSAATGYAPKSGLEEAPAATEGGGDGGEAPFGEAAEADAEAVGARDGAAAGRYGSGSRGGAAGGRGGGRGPKRARPSDHLDGAD